MNKLFPANWPEFKDWLMGRPLSAGPESGSSSAPKKMAFKLPSFVNVDVRPYEIGKYFSNEVAEKAIATLDKSVVMIISIAWIVAMLAMFFAFLAVKEASALKLKADTARAMEPLLPKISRVLLTRDQYDPLLQRLKKQFDGLQFEVTQKPSLRIYANNPDNFTSWLNAVSYIDSMVPSIRWSMPTFCVGQECNGDSIMQAELVGETINITKPENVQPEQEKPPELKK